MTEITVHSRRLAEAELGCTISYCIFDVDPILNPAFLRQKFLRGELFVVYAFWNIPQTS